MDDKSVAKHRSKIIQNGLGGATNTPNSQVEQPNSSSSIDAAMVPNSLKRRASVDIPSSSKSKTPKREMPKGQDLVDRIWLEIDNQQREKREKQAIRKAAEEAMRSHEPIEPFCLELTASNLKSLQHDDTLAKKFIQHETMVDKLLGYKMLLGRMENYSTLGYVKMRENNDDSPRARAQRDGVYGRSPSPQIFRRGPRTPPEEDEQDQKPVIIQKRGPQTPPGSPGPSTPPPPQSNNERHRLLIHMAQVTGASIEQVEIICGDALNRAIDNNNINKLEMLETFKTALISMANRHVPSNNSTPMKYKMCSLSDQMELVSDATLSGSPSSSPNPPPPPPPPPMALFAPLTAPPIPPPMLPIVPLQPPPQQPNSFSLPPMSIPPPRIGLPQPPPMICRPPPPPTHLPPPPIMPAMNIPPPPIVRSQNVLPPPPPQQHQKPKVELKSIVTVMPEQIPTVRVMPQWMNQPPPPIPPPNYAPQQSGISSHNVQNTLFSALGISGKDSFLSPPPPPPPPIDSSSSNIPNTSNIRSHYGNNNGGNTPNFKKGPPPPRFFF